MRIRPATPSDAAFIARAILEAVGFENPSESILLRQTEMCGRVDVLYSWQNTLVAECDGEVVGSLTSYDGRRYGRLRAVTFPLIRELCGNDYSVMENETCAGEYYLDSLYVDARFRRQGIATALIRKALEQAQYLRLRAATLLVSPEKSLAQRLYQSLGFVAHSLMNAFGETYIKMSQALSCPPLLEVCAPSLHSARVAADAGAPRIELCQRLDIGGLTPSYTDILACVRELPLQTFVLIRPRGGDFCYADAEFDTILSDIRFCRENGVHGVVVGFLNADGTVNLPFCRRAVAEAGPMQVTFHRAFDRCAEWNVALEQIIDCGFHRILTSGQQPTAMQGIDTLKLIEEKAASRIHILAGSGVRADNARHIMQATSVNEIHGSCKGADFETDKTEVVRLLKNIS